jgi:SulP family sulfate permease
MNEIFSSTRRAAALRLFPGLALFKQYKREWLRGDLVAGMTLCVVMIPSAIAYAGLMGLPPQHGLYAALVPLLIYPLFGSSRQVIVGPDIAISLLIAGAISPLALGDPQRAAGLAALLGLLTGMLLLLGALARFGAVADFFSKPVLVGYMSGAALILIASQLSPLFGLKLKASEFFPRLIELSNSLEQTHWPTLLLGLSFLAVLFLLHRIAPKIPGPLLVCLAGIVLSTTLRLDEHGMAVVGSFPRGLPSFSFPASSWRDIQMLLPAAVGIALLTYAEAILLARAFAARNGYDVDSNQELQALGVADLVVGLFQGFSVTGSQARTTINDASGGKTPLASLIASAGLIVFLLFLTRFIAKLPQVALAAILIYAGTGLIEVLALKQIYRFSPRSALVAALTTLSVLAAGVVPGIVFGVALSLLGLIHRISNPPDAVLAEIPGGGFHDLGLPSQTRTLPGLVVYRFYAPLLFPNMGHFVARVRELIAGAGGPVRWVLVDAQAISEIDVSAAGALHDLTQELRREGIALKIAHANRPLRESLERSGMTAELGPESSFGSVHECVEAFERSLVKSDKKTLPGQDTAGAQ